ncbi:MAG: hypothetical protein WA231_15955 [Methylocella sp.]
MTELTTGYLGATNLPHRGVEDFRATLQAREAKLAAAKKQRDTILIDTRKASAAADAGDQLARATLRDLTKADLAAGRLVGSLAGEVAESRKRLAMAETQAGLIAANKASSEAAALPRDKLFETVCPDGRKVRHRHHSLEALQKGLLPGYRAIGQVFGADADGNGGFVPQRGFLTAVLEAYESELVEWLEARGISGPGKPVPPNGREGAVQ